MSGLVDYGIIDPNQTNALARGYDAAVDRRNVLAQQERANKLADLQYQSAVDAVNKNRALQSFRANKNPQDKDYYAGLRMIDPALALEEESKQATINKTKAETDAKTFENKNKQLDYVWNGIGASATPQNAIDYITQGVKDGNLSMAQGSAEIKRLQNISQDDFRKYKIENVFKVLDAKEKFAQFKQTTRDTDLGGYIERRIEDAQGNVIGAPQQLRKTPTIGDMTAQGNLALSQNQEAWKRANPGYEIIQTETGSVGVNKNNPRDVVPISLDGQAVGMKPPPAKLIEVDTQLSALAGSLKAFKDEVAKRKITGAKGLFTGEDTANMTSKYTALLMGVKDLYTLGALTGPDMGIIENQLQNPATWAGAMTSKKAFDAQIQTIEDMLRRNHINTETAFGRPLKATAKAISGLGPDASAGVITNPQFPGFSVGRR